MCPPTAQLSFRLQRLAFETFGLAALVLIVTPSVSAEMIYGDFVGDTVVFESVTENADGLYGMPIVGDDVNSLAFSPLDFEAQAQSGSIDFLTSTLQFTLQADAGSAITAVSVEESGSFALRGSGTENTLGEVGVVLTANVLEVDNVAFLGDSQISSSENLITEDLISSPGLAQSWRGFAELNVAELAASELGITGDVTRISFSLSNQLAAFSEESTLSFFDKSQVDIAVTTESNGPDATAVPEPATAIVLVFAAGACVLRRNRIKPAA